MGGGLPRRILPLELATRFGGGALGLSGVPTDRDFHCLTQGPVIELLLSVHLHADGWSCTARHRHPGGKMTDCDNERYEKLTDAELSDVVSAVSWSLSARSPHF